MLPPRRSSVLVSLALLVLGCGASPAPSSSAPPREIASVETAPPASVEAPPNATTTRATAVEDGAPPEPRSKHLVASLQRGVCYGDCPAYLVRIFDDGIVVYEGGAFVKKAGLAWKRVPLEVLAKLQEAFKKADFRSFAKLYDERDAPTDQSWVVTTLWEGGRAQEVRHYYANPRAPKSLRALEETIDRLVDIEDFIGSDAERRELSRGLAH